MILRRYMAVAATALLSLVAACAQDAPTIIQPEVERAEVSATSVTDPVTGGPVAINYPKNAVFVDLPVDPAGPSFSLSNPDFCDPSVEICEPCDPSYQICDPPCDPVYDYGCEPCPRDNPAAWCYEPPCTPADGLINTFSTRRVGREPYATLEVSMLVSSRCNHLVVTGIGAHIIEDSKYSSLHVEYRQPYANGTLGSRVIYRTGRYPDQIPEAWASVPDGYAIVGVAAGQSGTHNLETLIVYYRRFELTASGAVRMTGPIFSLPAGRRPSGSLDAQYITYSDNEVFVGVGFQSSVEQTKTIASYVGTLP